MKKLYQILLFVLTSMQDKFTPLNKIAKISFSKKTITIDKIINPTIDIKGYLNVLE